MGRTPDVLVPSDRNITRSVNQGEPITLSQARSDAARSFRALAELYAADQRHGHRNGTAKRRRKLFRRGR